jgi:HEAT repeat protein
VLGGAIAGALFLPLPVSRHPESVSFQGPDRSMPSRLVPTRAVHTDHAARSPQERAETLERQATRAEVVGLVKTACSRNRTAADKAFATLIGMGDEAVPHLVQMLRDAHHPAEMRLIVRALTQIGTRDATEAVDWALRSATDDNRRDIIACGILDGAQHGADPRATDLIQDDAEFAMHLHAGRRLGRVAQQDSIWSWTDGYYRAESDAQRAVYIEALGSVTDPDLIPELEHVITTSPDDELAEAAALSLARIGTAESVAVIVQVIRSGVDDGRIRRLAGALGNVADSRVLESYRNDEDETVRRIVNDALDASQTADAGAAHSTRRTTTGGANDGDGVHDRGGQTERVISPAD